MKIILINDRDTDFIEQLMNVWERSVKATHLFLRNEDIQEIKKYVPQAIGEIEQLVVTVNEKNVPVAFMGTEKEKLEMQSQVEVSLNIPEVTEGKNGKYRQLIKEKPDEKIEESGNFGLAIAIAMLVFVVGVGVYENRGDIFGNRSSVEVDVTPHTEMLETETEGVAVEIISGSEKSE